MVDGAFVALPGLLRGEALVADLALESPRCRRGGGGGVGFLVSWGGRGVGGGEDGGGGGERGGGKGRRCGPDAVV